MKQKILYKFILVILGIAILSLILVTHKSQAANRVSVTAKVDPILTFSVDKKDSQGYELTISTNCSNGFIVNLSKEDSIIVQEEGSAILNIHTLTENFIYARL